MYLITTNIVMDLIRSQNREWLKFGLVLYRNKGNLPETRKICECFAGETQ